jgi:hypothetical protein
MGGREVWTEWQCGRIGRMLSPVMNVFLQLHVCCVSYNSGVYGTERLVHSITDVFHVVQIHINISIYSSVVHHVRILDKTFLGHEHSTMISSHRDDENWEDWNVGKCERLRR